MKNINVSISDEADKRLRVFQARRNLSNKDTAIDVMILEHLPPVEEE